MDFKVIASKVTGEVLVAPMSERGEFWLCLSEGSRWISERAMHRARRAGFIFSDVPAPHVDAKTLNARPRFDPVVRS